jgi:hypothetical protein
LSIRVRLQESEQPSGLYNLMAVGQFREEILGEMRPYMGIYQSDPPDPSGTFTDDILADLKHHAERPNRCQRPESLR